MLGSRSEATAAVSLFGACHAAASTSPCAFPDPAEAGSGDAGVHIIRCSLCQVMLNTALFYCASLSGYVRRQNMGSQHRAPV